MLTGVNVSERLAAAIRRRRIRGWEKHSEQMLKEGCPSLARRAALEAQVLKYDAKRRGWL